MSACQQQKWQILYNLFQSNSMIYPTSPAWSLQSRTKHQRQQPGPPPGAYSPDANVVLTKSPTWKLGKQMRRQASVKKTPAPNSYNPPTTDKSRKFGIFGHEKRLKQIISSTPGPGSYASDKNKQNLAGSFTHESKCLININQNPGPGAYDSCLSKQRTGIKMTREARFTTQDKETTPGPGQYECVRSNSGSHSFGRAERVSEPKRSSNPIGPGHYQFLTAFEENANERKGFTMVARHTTKHERASPGPANYSPTYRDLPTSPSITISRKYKERPSNHSPSPDQYDPKCFTSSKGECFSIGKAEKLPTKVDNYMPGPGAYLKAEYISTGVSISLGKSRKHEEGEDFPGPGAYNPIPTVIQQRPKSAKIGLSKRFEKLNTESSPSPALYDTQTSCFDNPRYSFPKKKRLNSKRESLPGPGAYNIPPSVFPRPPSAFPLAAK